MNNIILTNETEQMVINRSKELNAAVFVTKDVVVLDGLLAREISYGHSNGNIHGRQQTLDTVASDKTVYSDVKFETPSAIPAGNAMMIRHVLRAQTDIEGKIASLNLGLVQVWVLEDGAWKMAGRQAFRL